MENLIEKRFQKAKEPSNLKRMMMSRKDWLNQLTSLHLRLRG
jgi:hypothetical protein